MGSGNHTGMSGINSRLDAGKANALYPLYNLSDPCGLHFWSCNFFFILIRTPIPCFFPLLKKNFDKFHSRFLLAQDLSNLYSWLQSLEHEDVLLYIHCIFINILRMQYFSTLLGNCTQKNYVNENNHWCIINNSPRRCLWLFVLSVLPNL